MNTMFRGMAAPIVESRAMCQWRKVCAKDSCTTKAQGGAHALKTRMAALAEPSVRVRWLHRGDRDVGIRPKCLE